MAGLTDSLSSVISSIFATIRAIFETLFHSIQSVFALVQNAVMSVVDLAGGIVNFVLGTSLPYNPMPSSIACAVLIQTIGHVVIIGVLIAAYVGYTVSIFSEPLLPLFESCRSNETCLGSSDSPNFPERN